MNVNLDYDSGQSYSQFFTNYKITISGGGTKRIRVAITEKGNSRARLSFSLPKEKSAQVAHAMLAAWAGIDQVMECSFEEPKPKSTSVAA
jgi:hypothetical protein